VVIALAVAAVAIFLIVVAGATPFVDTPIVIVALGVAAAWAGLARRMGERTLETDVPSIREASYDPGERALTPTSIG
jgi:hypothetical protein